MVNRLFNMAFGAVIGQLMKERIRSGSIQAVKAYIHLVKGARGVVMGLAVLGVAAAVLVAGILLVVVGLVGLLPVDPNTVSLILVGIGVVLSAVAVTAAALVFSEKRWLEVSKAYDLMDAALAPWDGILPPNPIEVMRGHTVSPAAPTLDQIQAARVRQVESELKNQIELRTEAPAPSIPEPTPQRGPDFSRPVFAPGH